MPSWQATQLPLAAAAGAAAGAAMPACLRAHMLGLNTLRFRAFADGAPGVGSAVSAEWGQHEEDAMSRHIALQPAPGILNGTMLR
jgi:hypothetical protein